MIILDIGKLDMEVVTVYSTEGGEEIYYRFSDGQWDIQLGGYREEGISLEREKELEELYQKKVQTK